MAALRAVGRSFASRSQVFACNGMACTSHPLATQTAIDILRKGGTAIDAAIGANAVLGVCEPHSCGIGGDLCAIVYEGKTGKLHGLNGTGRSPMKLTLEEFQKRNYQRIPKFGPYTVTVPGCVDGWFEMHKKFGQLPMSQLLAYAIDYAEKGFPVTPGLALASLQSVSLYTKYPNYQKLYGQKPKTLGEIHRNPQLASTLRLIANENGRNEFYEGSLASRILNYDDCWFTLEDLKRHTSSWVDPLTTRYRGHDVYELPPNGQGIAVLQMLNILEEFDFSQMERGSFEHIHLFLETKKLVYEDRARFYADIDYMQPDIIDKLLSKEYASKRRSLINMSKASSVIEPSEILSHGDTIYLTTADEHGNMVSLLQSHFSSFGSGCMPEGLGFILQSRGSLFTLKEGLANTYGPFKRPFHTIIPGFVMKDGQPWLSFGITGGAFQPLAQVQILMNIIDFGLNTQEAGDAPRIDHEGSSEPTGKPVKLPGMVVLESGFNFETIRQLMAVGHQVGWSPPKTYGGYQAIQFDSHNKVYIGASDSRKDGHAAGY